MCELFHGRVPTALRTSFHLFRNRNNIQRERERERGGIKQVNRQIEIRDRNIYNPRVSIIVYYIKLEGKIIYPFFVRNLSLRMIESYFELIRIKRFNRFIQNDEFYAVPSLGTVLVHLSLNSWRIILVNSYRIHRFDTNFTVRIFPASQQSWRYIVTLTITTMGRRININRVCKSGETAQI